MTQLNTLVDLLSYITILSVTIERLVELVKPMIDEFCSRLVLNDRVRRAMLYLASFGGGAVIHSMSGTTIPYFADPTVAAMVAGLLVSGGSGVWHDLLSILGDFKTKVTVTK